jgi:hypothetical protein
MSVETKKGEREDTIILNKYIVIHAKSFPMLPTEASYTKGVHSRLDSLASWILCR